MDWRKMIALNMVMVMGMALSADGARAQIKSIVRANVSSSGEQADGFSLYPAVSGNGRYVAFVSWATNLVDDDTNANSDVFVHDLISGITQRVSLDSSGGQAAGYASSGYLSISTDGRYVAFSYNATNFDPRDSDTSNDIYVRDRTTGETELVSVSTAGIKGAGDSNNPSISGDGRYIAYNSAATNLVLGDTNFANDIFVRDRSAGTTELVSVSTAGTLGNNASTSPSISSDGRYIAFTSGATNLVTGDDNRESDIFVRDQNLGTTEMVSVSTAGVKGNFISSNPIISANGRYVSFESAATNLVEGDTNLASDLFVRDLQSGTTERVSIGSNEEEANGGIYTGYGGTLSADGRYVAFYSDSVNLVSGDSNGLTDVFRRDRDAGATLRLNMTYAGGQMSDGYMDHHPAISGDGMVNAFASSSSTLVEGDTNSLTDIFVVTTQKPFFWPMFIPHTGGN